MANKKASVFISGIGNDICSPFFDESGKLCVVRQNSGCIITVNSVGNTKNLCSTGGQPSSAIYNNAGVLYVADFGHSAILAVQKDGQQELVVGVYEDKPLRGPNCITMVNGDIFFTDSGIFGETGLHSPTGSIFTITNSPSGQILKPISLGNLAHPTGIVVTPDGKFMYVTIATALHSLSVLMVSGRYVAEMMTNRILRFFQQPAGVYHGSVFHQLAGGVGPSCLAIDESGHLYVGHFELRNSETGFFFIIFFQLCSSSRCIMQLTMLTGLYRSFPVVENW